MLNIILSGLFSVACNMENGGPLSVTPGNWGHLSGLANTLPSKLYLSHVKKDESYNMCLAQYMVDKYPGIENEVKAAANIWGYYIERSLNTNVITVDLPVAEFGETEEEVLDKYLQFCPADTHLVIGESFFSDFAAAKTLSKYNHIIQRDGRSKVVSFKRALFLKKLPESGDELYEEETDDLIIWKSLSQVTGQALNVDEILELMKKRQTTVYLTGNYELLTFKTIVHEFGHIWGLCDQYVLDGDQTNCDGEFATINEEGHIILHDKTMMSKSSWIGKLYLADDDIEGIRQLAERPEFAHDWPLATSFRQLEVPKISGQKSIELAQINSAKVKGTTLAINMNLVTTEALSLHTKILDKNTESWIEFEGLSFNKPVSYKDYTVEMALGRYYNPQKVKVTLTTKNSNTKITIEAPVTKGSPSVTLGN